MKKLIILLCMMFITSQITFAQTTNEKYVKTFEQFMEASGGFQAFKQVADAMLKNMYQAMPQIPEDVRNVLSEQMNKELYDTIIKGMAPLYQKHMSIKDLNACIKFYQTPTGKKLVETSPKIMQEFMTTNITWVQELQQRVIKVLEEKGYGKN
ncbi:MAG: DUF2059 domain-containing protein [Marinifilaceae bacterium]